MKRILAAVCIVLCLCGCAGQAGTEVSGFAPGEESRLVLWTDLDESLYGPLVTEFQNRTGIWVQVETGEPENWDAALVSGAGDREGDWVEVTVSPLVLVYNPKMVRLQIPSGWESLLDPVWQGEIAFAEPGDDAASGYTLGLIYEYLGEAGLEAFSANVPVLLESQRAVAEAVADGSFCIGVVTEDVARTAIAAGYSLVLLEPEEGTCTASDWAAVGPEAEHKENGEEFLEFLLSEDAQGYMAEHCFRRSPSEAGKVDGQALWEACEAAWERLREVAP